MFYLQNIYDCLSHIVILSSSQQSIKSIIKKKCIGNRPTILTAETHPSPEHGEQPGLRRLPKRQVGGCSNGVSHQGDVLPTTCLIATAKGRDMECTILSNLVE